MLTKDDYDRLKHKRTEMYSEVQQIESEATTERKKLTNQIKSSIEDVLKQDDDHSELQDRLNTLIDQHTRAIVKSTKYFYEHRVRIEMKLWDIVQEIDRHANHSFMWGYKHVMGQDNPHGNQLHWDVYFRHEKFNEHSRVFFLNPTETTWTYADDTDGTIDDLVEQSMLSGYHTLKWLEGYNIPNDTLVIKLISG